MLSNLIEKAQSFIAGRRTAYVKTFKNVVGDIVLQDLAKFCRAYESTGHRDALIAARLDGRREVWLRIAHHLNLSDSELWDLYRKTNLTTRTE